MGLIDKLTRVGGILKNRLASSVSALRGVVGRIPAPIRKFARVGRLTSPVGLGLTALTFAPQITRFLQRAIPRGVAFIGGRRVVSGIAGGAGAGVVAGLFTGGRKSGEVSRPGEIRGPPPLPPRRGTGPGPGKRRRRIDPITGRPVTPRARRRARPGVRRRARPIRRHRHKVISVPVRRKRGRRKRTHSSPRHRGHKRVSFTTASGKKVSFLANPKARHR